MKTYKAAFVGTGMIGAGLAANAALNNFDVTLYDVVDRDKMKSNLTHIMDILVEAEAITQEEADAAEPESLTHAETGTPVKVDDSWSGPIDTS